MICILVSPHCGVRLLAVCFPILVAAGAASPWYFLLFAFFFFCSELSDGDSSGLRCFGGTFNFLSLFGFFGRFEFFFFLFPPFLLFFFLLFFFCASRSISAVGASFSLVS